MLTIIDTEKLLMLFQDFHILTDVPICLFDENFNEILRYPKDRCQFCQTVRKDERVEQLCKASDNYAFQKCKQTKLRYTYRCHMNLIETATPLLYDNTIIGYIMIGQIADANSKIKTINYCFDENIKSLYNDIPHLNDDKIFAASHIADACAGYLYILKLLSSQKQTLAQKINDYLLQNISSNICVEALCTKFDLSRTELYKTFSRLFNLSVADYVKSFRLEYAKKLLLTTTLSIKKIAECCGIGDYNYFSKIFKKHFKASPITFRKKTRI